MESIETVKTLLSALRVTSDATLRGQKMAMDCWADELRVSAALGDALGAALADRDRLAEELAAEKAKVAARETEDAIASKAWDEAEGIDGAKQTTPSVVATDNELHQLRNTTNGCWKELRGRPCIPGEVFGMSLPLAIRAVVKQLENISERQRVRDEIMKECRDALGLRAWDSLTEAVRNLEEANAALKIAEATGDDDKRIVDACRRFMGLHGGQALPAAVADMMEENRKLRGVKAPRSRLPGGPIVINGRTRRNDIGLRTEAENVIAGAVHAVEAAGCHEWLTEAVNKLNEARELVADFVERDQ